MKPDNKPLDALWFNAVSTDAHVADSCCLLWQKVGGGVGSINGEAADEIKLCDGDSDRNVHFIQFTEFVLCLRFWSAVEKRTFTMNGVWIKMGPERKGSAQSESLHASSVSGTSCFHGSVSEQLCNPVLSAANWDKQLLLGRSKQSKGRTSWQPGCVYRSR